LAFYGATAESFPEGRQFAKQSMLALDAVFDLVGPDGARSIVAEDFFNGLFETDLGPEEVLVHVRIPPQKRAHAQATASVVILLPVTSSWCQSARPCDAPMTVKARPVKPSERNSDCHLNVIDEFATGNLPSA
jgi:FAD binding domain in molybdopterin dehydrogenase